MYTGGYSPPNVRDISSIKDPTLGVPLKKEQIFVKVLMADLFAARESALIREEYETAVVLSRMIQNGEKL